MVVEEIALCTSGIPQHTSWKTVLIHTGIVCLQKYQKNLKAGQLTDSTLMLWNDR